VINLAEWQAVHCPLTNSKFWSITNPETESISNTGSEVAVVETGSGA
jgi:hypothetical protein